MTLPHVLIIAGSDSSGGAGIVRDIETANSLFCKSSVAITAVTAQTHQGVVAVEPMSPLLIAQQIEAAHTANVIRAVKIGMVATVENIATIANRLANMPNQPIVYDPVLVASSGGSLARHHLKDAILSKLLPHINLLTPNISELANLLGEEMVKCDRKAIDQANSLIAMGAKAVLVKGGHLNGINACDYLVTKQDVIEFCQPRLVAQMRGTGCTLSTAISCNLAKGDSLPQAIGKAKEYLYAKLLKIIDSKI
ncbi:hydroxymethylpyrimidine/phosphomethylpyrimidine kinase [Bartonella sp. HY329]|uniref:hydroxymethylpyrimidine/phosphomethylpyrimidine kinase n=1 Tax=unclassified Bartonella TaxID=2645622 RepID=UPI0021C7703C|nr:MULTISPECIES: hydroxymethylpyrimidine/phosphomethylpyrimidine kinase [unclassified Bartonella]UXM94620.1 hydroxymethylpyrimidine/phosphomethylpyrimidine kinase [Bartonella sp. HY329]UXN08943.1 hydroxymethylpyrimidine/phosphomethylpyrimidine kinase [Bartonella sp. HY328]